MYFHGLLPFKVWNSNWNRGWLAYKVRNSRRERERVVVPIISQWYLLFQGCYNNFPGFAITTNQSHFAKPNFSGEKRRRGHGYCILFTNCTGHDLVICIKSSQRGAICDEVETTVLYYQMRQPWRNAQIFRANHNRTDRTRRTHWWLAWWAATGKTKFYTASLSKLPPLLTAITTIINHCELPVFTTNDFYRFLYTVFT